MSTNTSPPVRPGGVPMASRLKSMNLGAWSMIISYDQQTGLGLVRTKDGRFGLLRWTDPEAASDPALEDRILWARAGTLLPVAEEVERDLGLAAAPEHMLLSTVLRAAYREVH